MRSRFVTVLLAGVPPAQISAALHDGATAIADVAVRAGERTMVLTGGCFQNARLTERAVAALRAAHFEAVWQRRARTRSGRVGRVDRKIWRSEVCLAVPGRILSLVGDDPLLRVGR